MSNQPGCAAQGDVAVDASAAPQAPADADWGLDGADDWGSADAPSTSGGGAGALDVSDLTAELDTLSVRKEEARSS